MIIANGYKNNRDKNQTKNMMGANNIDKTEKKRNASAGKCGTKKN